MAAPIVVLTAAERNDLWDAIDFTHAGSYEVSGGPPEERAREAAEVIDALTVQQQLGWEPSASEGTFPISVPRDQFQGVLDAADKHVREILADRSKMLLQVVDKGDPGEFVPDADDSERIYIQQAFTIRAIRERLGVGE